MTKNFDRKKKRQEAYFKNRMVTENTMSYEEYIQVGKIPDFVKELPVFDGKASELMRWVMEVEHILQMYAKLPRDSAAYHVIEGTIRRKIKGEAADVLNSNCVTSRWSHIKSTLLLYYKDKRELKTLDHELSAISKKQGGSLSSYFSRVNDLQNAIIRSSSNRSEICC